MRKPLTAQQSRALEFIRDYSEEMGCPPTDAEVGRWIGVGQCRANAIVWRLSELGYLFRDTRRGRSVELV